MDWRGLALVAAGGALGAAARYGVSSVLAAKGFPWATLLVNLAGSLAIGYLLLGRGVPEGARLFAVVGFLGGFTTLSAYSAETVHLWRSAQVPLAVANAVANGVGGPLCALLGWKLAG